MSDFCYNILKKANIFNTIDLILYILFLYNDNLIKNKMNVEIKRYSFNHISEPKIIEPFPIHFLN